MLYSPWKVAILGCATWLFFWFIAPFTPNRGLDHGAMIYIALGYTALVAGCVTAELTRSAKAEFGLANRGGAWRGPFQPTLFWVSAGVGAAAVVLRFVDHAQRGVVIGDDSAEVRDALQNSGFSALSAIGSTILPFCFVPLLLVLGSRWSAQRIPVLLVAILLFALPALDSLATLSRSVLVMSAVFGVFTVSCLKFDGSVTKFRFVLGAVLGILAISVLSTAIFNQRLTDYGRSINDSISQSAYMDNFSAPSDIISKVSFGTPMQRTYYQTIIPNSAYYTHGLWEFSRLWTRPDEQPFAYGSYLFYPYTKVFSMLSGQKKIVALDDDRLFVRVGVFQTFFGPWYVDFGYFGVVLLYLLGYAATRLGEYTRQGYLNSAPLYIFLITIIFVMPSYNLLSSGLGFFMFHGFAIFWFFTAFTAPTPSPIASARTRRRVAPTGPSS
jgi:hypothetical protein